MKITFLGTSHGVPAADRFCSCTLVEVGDAAYLIDAGAPAIDLLLRRGTPLERIRALFTTHLHGDHVNGVLPLADLFTWYFTKTDIDIYMTEQRGIDAFRAVLSATLDDKLCDARVRFRLMTPETVYADGRIRLTPFPTQHLAGAGRPAYSYLLEAEGKKVFFSGDLSSRLECGDFPAYVLENEVDVMACEMAHFGLAQVTPYLARCKAKELCFTHVFPLEKLAQIDALGAPYGYPIRTVRDGDVIEL